MRKGLMLAAALMMPVGGLVPIQAVGAEVTYAAQGPVVELVTYSHVESEADMAMIVVNVTAKGKTSHEALANASKVAEKVFTAIRPFAEKPSDIETNRISVNEDFDWSGEKRVSLGYVASTSYTVEMRDLNKINDMLNAATAAGATDIDGPIFGLQDSMPAQAQARKQGLDGLLLRAKEHAKWAGYDDVKIVWVAEEFENRGMYEAESAAGAVAEISPSEPPRYNIPIMPGKITTTVLLKATFEMVKK